MTKAVTSSIIAGLGDFLCQIIESRYITKKRAESQKGSLMSFWDPIRTGKFMTLGAIYIAPFLHVNYTYVLPYLFPSTATPKAALKKLIFDQTVLAPTSFFLFYNVINRLDGKNQQEVNEQLRYKFWPTMIMNWKIWPFLNFMNFYLIPIHYQVLFNNVFSMFFNGYLSYMHHSFEQVPA